MTRATSETVRSYFDAEVVRGRRLVPAPDTAGGLGTYRKYARAVALMSEPDVRDVLDVGCNRGSVEWLFHEMAPGEAAVTHVEGVDVSTQAIARARALELPNCSFQAYDGDRLPFDDARFDLVVMIEVLEHVMDKNALLREIHRVLRPGGRLYLTTPNPECLALRIESALWGALRFVARRRPPLKDAFIPQRELAALLAHSGFDAPATGWFAWPRAFVQMSGWGIVPPLPPAALLRFQRFCVERLEHDGRPLWLDRILMWTLVADVRKPGP